MGASAMPSSTAWAAQRRDQARLALAVHPAPTAVAGGAPMQRHRPAVFDDRLPQVGHGFRVHVQRLADLGIRPGRTPGGAVRFQQERARVSLRAAALPFATIASNCPRSSSVNVMTYFVMAPSFLLGRVHP